MRHFISNDRSHRACDGATLCDFKADGGPINRAIKAGLCEGKRVFLADMRGFWGEGIKTLPSLSRGGLS